MIKKLFHDEYNSIFLNDKSELWALGYNINRVFGIKETRLRTFTKIDTKINGEISYIYRDYESIFVVLENGDLYVSGLNDFAKMYRDSLNLGFVKVNLGTKVRKILKYYNNVYIIDKRDNLFLFKDNEYVVLANNVKNIKFNSDTLFIITNDNEFYETPIINIYSKKIKVTKIDKSFILKDLAVSNFITYATDIENNLYKYEKSKFNKIDLGGRKVKKLCLETNNIAIITEDEELFECITNNSYTRLGSFKAGEDKIVLGNKASECFIKIDFKLKIKDIYCTNSCIGILTEDNRIFIKGLNNRCRFTSKPNTYIDDYEELDVSYIHCDFTNFYISSKYSLLTSNKEESVYITGTPPITEAGLKQEIIPNFIKVK